jgi:hypothetical protein
MSDQVLKHLADIHHLDLHHLQEVRLQVLKLKSKIGIGVILV